MPAFSIGKAPKCNLFLNIFLGKVVTTTPMITPGPGAYMLVVRSRKSAAYSYFSFLCKNAELVKQKDKGYIREQPRLAQEHTELNRCSRDPNFIFVADILKANLV